MNLTFLIVSAVKIALVLVVLLTTLAYTVWVERKVAGHIQNRWGPTRTGPHGLLQPLADLIKFIVKEDPLPGQAQKFVYFLAPFLALVTALLSITVIPFGDSITIAGETTWLQITDLNIGLLFILAVTSLGVYGISLAGWSSGSKYSLYGGLRSSAQMVSYELALSFSLVGPLLLANTLSLRDIVMAQGGYYFGVIPKWNVIPQCVGFVCYMIAAFAETNRIPFDLPEAEAELVAGFHTEYSSLKFAMFFTAEYANMVTAACIATTLFLGGWLSPIPPINDFPVGQYFPVVALLGVAAWIAWQSFRPDERLSEKIVLKVFATIAALAGLAFLWEPIRVPGSGVFWFVAKVGFFLFFYIWVRWTLPRFRYDQLMSFGWKFLVPVAVAKVLITGLIVALGSGK